MIFAANFVIKAWPIADKCCDKGKWNNIFAIMMFKYLVAASFTPLEISIFSSETLKLRLWVEFLISTNGVFSALLGKYFGLVKWIIKHCRKYVCVFATIFLDCFAIFLKYHTDGITIHWAAHKNLRSACLDCFAMFLKYRGWILTINLRRASRSSR